MKLENDEKIAIFSIGSIKLKFDLNLFEITYLKEMVKRMEVSNNPAIPIESKMCENDDNENFLIGFCTSSKTIITSADPLSCETVLFHNCFAFKGNPTLVENVFYFKVEKVISVSREENSSKNAYQFIRDVIDFHNLKEITNK